MRWARRRPLRDDEVWTILRVDNCSEVDLVGNSYKQDGKYYDNCCDLENENEDECDEWWKPVLIFFIVWLILIFGGPILGEFGIFSWFWDCVKTFCSKCYNTCCARCELQSIVRNENNATRYRTERSNISTISANIRQPPTPSSETMAQYEE